MPWGDDRLGNYETGGYFTAVGYWVPWRSTWPTVEPVAIPRRPGLVVELALLGVP